MRNKNTMALIAFLLIFAVLAFGLLGCRKKIEVTQTDFKCDKPYIQKGSECCLDRNDNKICDEDESGESKSEDKPSVKELKEGVIGQIIRYGETYDLYSDSQYDHSSSDSIFNDYNKSIKLDGKQCHIIAWRTHKYLKEEQPYWRPLPISCEKTDDCYYFIKSKDPYLSMYMKNKYDVLCRESRFNLK